MLDNMKCSLVAAVHKVKGHYERMYLTLVMQCYVIIKLFQVVYCVAGNFDEA